jgi:ATP-binding cassette, subfamily B, bacterial
MGFYSSLMAEKYDRQYSDRQLFARIIHYFKPHIWKLVWVIVTLLVISAAGAAQPWAVSHAVDLLQQNPTGGQIALISGLVLGIGLTSWIASYIQRRLMMRTIADTLLQLATDAFQAAANHDLSFYDEYSSGRIQSRITSDTRDFGNLVGLVTDLGSQVITSVILGVVLFRIEPRLTVYLFAMIPVVFVFTISYRQLARKVTRAGFRAMANVNATIKETVSGIAVAKNFRQESGVYTEFNEANTTSYKVNVRRGLVLSLLWPALNTIGGVMSALMIYFGGLSAAQGMVTAGAWYLFLLSLDRFLYPVMSLSSFWTSVQTGLSAAERVFALIDADPNVKQMDHQQVPCLKGQIDFEHVQFRYKENEPVLPDFSLNIAPGETVALVGHTGAGKSSIAKLIARFYEFQGGRILIDGGDIRTFDLVDYRRRLGIVSQVPFLFSGTVLDNIRYACSDVTEHEIDAIARQIGDGEWLETLPQGLKTETGERGSRLSMGQRQLVALMRVLVQKPSIFILDEATASIDPFTEWQIQQALNLILEKTTSILIAHRLSTVRSANRIIVMENGQIIETGNHEGLLAAGGHYASLYNTYFRHQSLAFRPEGLDEFLEYKARMRMTISADQPGFDTQQK